MREIVVYGDGKHAAASTDCKFDSHNYAILRQIAYLGDYSSDTVLSCVSPGADSACYSISGHKKTIP